jgi:serine/threonine-protein kinase
LHDDAPQRLGRYVLFGEIAAGGTATVHVGRMTGPLGFARTVAIKRLHPQLARDPDFSAMLLDEARLAARVRHPNVAAILDVVAGGPEDGAGADRSLALVMELVTGESLSRLLRLQRAAGRSTPVPVAAAIVAGIAHGLHAAHEAKGEDGAPLAIVHRDVSPQNVLLGADGVPRLVDFGIAKAASRAQVTREGEIKGKFSYMAPEQLGAAYGEPGAEITRAVDVYAAGLVLFELLTGARAIDADDERALIAKVQAPSIPAPSSLRPEAAPLDEVVARALALEPRARFASARALALGIEAAVPIATASQVGAWVESLAHDALAERAARIAAIERADAGDEADLGEARAPISREGGATVRVRGERVEASSAPLDEASARTAPQARKSMPIALLAAAAIALLTLGAVGLRALGRGDDERRASVGVSATSAVTSASNVPSATANAAVASATAAISTAATPPSSASTAAPSSQRGVASTARATPTTAAATTSTAPIAPTAPNTASTSTAASTKPPAACDPPYTVDSKGRKIYKVECL